MKNPDYMTQLEKSLSQLIRIPSVYDASTASQDSPYGKGVADALSYVADLARSDGFEVTTYEGHAVAIHLPGSTSGRIDIVSHVDVVEPGPNWSHAPFGAEVEGNFMYGRGTQDMKTAFLLTYYALKTLKERRVPFARELRLVVGGDEERTMEDMAYYIHKAGRPDFAFTPDGAFPLALGEKGALMWRLQGPVESCIISLYGGVQCNVVPPSATADVQTALSENDYQAAFASRGITGTVHRRESGVLHLEVTGKASHASRPESGKSAVTDLCSIIAQLENDSFSQLITHVFTDYYGTGATIDYDIPPMGKLTINMGVLQVVNGNLYAEIDCRYPYGITSALLTEKLTAHCAPYKISLDYDAPPTLVDESSPFVQQLIASYQSATGDMASRPFISGGVTYGKVVPDCVAFGPLLPGEESKAHQADERVDCTTLPLLLELYTDAMFRLATVDIGTGAKEKK